MMRPVAIGLMLVLLVACGRSPYTGYKHIGEDMHLKLHMLGDGTRLPQDGDVVLMRLRISDVDSMPGSFYSTEGWFLVDHLRKSAFDQLMIRMHEGDSMSMITRADMLPWQAIAPGRIPAHVDEQMLRTEASMIAIRLPKLAQEPDTLGAMDPQQREAVVLEEFLERLGQGWQRWGTSMVHYYIEGHAQDTTTIRRGDVVTISYTGRRLQDGQVFDSTERNGAPLTFRYGDKDQVVNGLEVAIGLLREGQQADVVLPSEYAFGDRGVEGVLEPYSPVFYTVRVEHVQRAGKAPLGGASDPG